MDVIDAWGTEVVRDWLANAGCADPVSSLLLVMLC